MQTTPNQLHFSGQLTAADVKRHIPHEFTLPAGCTGLTIHLHFDPLRVADIRNMLTLTLFDPNGFRGAGHRGGNSHEVSLSHAQATPGYRPGPLPAGQWTVQIDTHMVMPGEECSYALSVEMHPTPPQVSQNAPLSFGPPALAAQRPVLKATPGWYRGDLHGHTIHSDGSWQASDLVAAAGRLGLDFVTLTDHNTVSSLAEMAALTGPNLLTLVGMELTTFWGHALCLGSRQWIDWRVDRAGDEMGQIARRTDRAGELFVIAHPMDKGDPTCTGCRWLYPKMMPGPAQLVEVWNEAWWGKDGRSREKNEGSLALYYSWLNAGHRLVATAGSDTHGQAHYDEGPGFNVVYAEALSEPAILEAIAQGHLYLSAGPELRLNATTMAGDMAMMGDVLPVAPDTEVAVLAHWANCPADAVLHLVVNGQSFHERIIPAQGEDTWLLKPREANWFTLELRSTAGELLALTNPIFVER